MDTWNNPMNVLTFELEDDKKAKRVSFKKEKRDRNCVIA